MAAGTAVGIGAIVLLALCVVGVGVVALARTTDSPSPHSSATREPDASRPPRVTTADAAELASVMKSAGARIGKEWAVGEDLDTMPRTSACMPARLGEGQVAIRQTTWRYRPVGDGESGTLQVSLYRYRTSRQMTADLKRSGTARYKACLLTNARDAYTVGAIANESITRQPSPFGLDGANYQIRYLLAAAGSTGLISQLITEQVTVVGVGKVRAVIQPLRCCARWESDGERTVVAGVVLAMAKVQSMPDRRDLVRAAAGPYLSEGPNPCGLLSDADVAPAMPFPAPPSRSLAHGKDGEVACTWISGPDSVQLITTVDGYQYKPPSSEPVAGVGDRAAWIAQAQSLIVWIHGRNFVVAINAHDPASARTTAVTLARVVLGHRHPDPPPAAGGG